MGGVAGIDIYWLLDIIIFKRKESIDYKSFLRGTSLKSHLLFILTIVWVLNTPNAGQNINIFLSYIFQTIRVLPQGTQSPGVGESEKKKCSDQVLACYG